MRTGLLRGRASDPAGASRSFALAVPSTYDRKTAYPLVVAFHGDGGDGEGIRAMLALEREGGEQALFAYPDGVGRTWRIDDAAGLAADVGFADALVTRLASTHCVDAARVFLVGFSKGAYFANQLACRSTTPLRGVVTHAGGGPFGLSAAEYGDDGRLQCPAAPLAALQFHGEDDRAVALTEGEKTREHHRLANGCESAAEPLPSSPCAAYAGCERGLPEIWCSIAGLGHEVWPQAASTTWSFFRGLR